MTDSEFTAILLQRKRGIQLAQSDLSARISSSQQISPSVLPRYSGVHGGTGIPGHFLSPQSPQGRDDIPKMI
jgi:hypothetical protein